MSSSLLQTSVQMLEMYVEPIEDEIKLLMAKRKELHRIIGELIDLANDHYQCDDELPSLHHEQTDDDDELHSLHPEQIDNDNDEPMSDVTIPVDPALPLNERVKQYMQLLNEKKPSYDVEMDMLNFFKFDPLTGTLSVVDYHLGWDLLFFVECEDYFNERTQPFDNHTYALHELYDDFRTWFTLANPEKTVPSTLEFVCSSLHILNYSTLSLKEDANGVKVYHVNNIKIIE